MKALQPKPSTRGIEIQLIEVEEIEIKSVEAYASAAKLTPAQHPRDTATNAPHTAA